MISEQGLLNAIKDVQQRINSLAEAIILAGDIRKELLENARNRDISEEKIRDALALKTND